MAFAKGVSGNPHGGSSTAELRRAAKQEAERCISTLAAVRDDSAAPPAVRVDAASRILSMAGFQIGPSSSPPSPAL